MTKSIIRIGIIGISVLGIAFTNVSCGKKGSQNDGSTSDSNSNVQPISIIPSLSTLYKKSVNDSNLYSASGLGGLGKENSQDRLDLYSGIQVQTNPNYNTDVSIIIKDKSDRECYSIFTYVRNNPQISINASGITKPINCNLSINLTATNVKTGIQEVNFIKDFPVRINLTMKAYMQINDKSYLQFAGRDSIDDYRFSEIVDQLKLGRITIDKLNLDNLNFLEGAKDILQSFEATKSTISDYSMFAQFKNLKNVRLDNANINDSNIKDVLSNMPKLDKLSVQNNNLSNISPIIDTQENLNELDLSGNSNIQNLYVLRRLKKLNKISIRKMNLMTLLPLNNLTQITDLDISENPLRKFTDADTGYLSNLTNLEALNVSVDRDNPNSSPITDKVLNDYFLSLRFQQNQKLKKFVDRNRWGFFGRDCDMINNFEKTVRSISLLNNLEYLDLHGNSCRDDWGIYHIPTGLVELPSIGFVNLKYLNISDTAVQNLRGLPGYYNNIIFVFNETPDNLNTGILISRESCYQLFQYGSGQNQKQCEGLKPENTSL